MPKLPKERKVTPSVDRDLETVYQLTRSLLTDQTLYRLVLAIDKNGCMKALSGGMPNFERFDLAMRDAAMKCLAEESELRGIEGKAGVPLGSTRPVSKPPEQKEPEKTNENRGGPSEAEKAGLLMVWPDKPVEA